MSYAVTGSEGTSTAEAKSMGPLIVFNAGNNEASPTYRFLDYQRRDFTAAPAVERMRPDTQSKYAKKADQKAKLRRDVARRKIIRATTEAEGMIAAAESEEPTRVNNLTYKLRDTLQDLWEMRHDREEDWSDILNALQIVLERDEVGGFSVPQCKAIRDVIVDHLALMSVDGVDLEECIVVLALSGLDPFEGASPTGADELTIDDEVDQ